MEGTLSCGVGIMLVADRTRGRKERGMAELQEEILKISAGIRETEQVLTKYPGDKSLLLTLKSAQRQVRALEEELAVEIKDDEEGAQP